MCLQVQPHRDTSQDNDRNFDQDDHDKHCWSLIYVVTHVRIILLVISLPKCYAWPYHFQFALCHYVKGAFENQNQKIEKDSPFRKWQLLEYPSVSTYNMNSPVQVQILYKKTWGYSSNYSKVGSLCVLPSFYDLPTPRSLRQTNFHPFRLARTAKSMSSTVVLSFHPPDSLIALMRHKPAVPRNAMYLNIRSSIDTIRCIKASIQNINQIYESRLWLWFEPSIHFKEEEEEEESTDHVVSFLT